MGELGYGDVVGVGAAAVAARGFGPTYLPIRTVDSDSFICVTVGHVLVQSVSEGSLAHVFNVEGYCVRSGCS